MHGGNASAGKRERGTAGGAFRDSRRASASGVASHRASRCSSLRPAGPLSAADSAAPPPCRGPVARPPPVGDPSASRQPPCRDPSASLQGPVRLPSLLLPAAAPSPQGQCPPLLTAPSSRSLLRPLLLSPAPLPCSG
ncbi:hypothetical protein PVAP13_4NG274411 [Panicum virgatum]|uniref:Uncharacterized protein n=1 Tax=Panicum virgatum TaxID=38727 RepID=A0A8T0T9Z8_PANVG|nr:hypothetical protein PVAP13_4NG274411 [Panicum virgatum]